jgi:predicted dehydrogenase
MECVKLGIIGIGTMGSVHAQTIMEGKVARCKLTAVCDPNPERLKRFSSPDAFYSVEDLLRCERREKMGGNRMDFFRSLLNKNKIPPAGT